MENALKDIQISKDVKYVKDNKAFLMSLLILKFQLSSE